MQTPIVPKSVTSFPAAPATANTLTIQICRAVDNSGRCGYTWQLDDVQPVSPATVPPTFTTTLRASGSSEVTLPQWSAWASGGTVAGDEAYQLACIAANIGVTTAS